MAVRSPSKMIGRVMTEYKTCPACWGPVHFADEDGDTWPNGRYRLPTVPWDEAVASWDNWIVCPTCGGTGRVPDTKHVPWRDRPDSLMRGYVLGCAVGGLVFAVFSLLLLPITPWTLLLTAMCTVLGGLGTYM